MINKVKFAVTLPLKNNQGRSIRARVNSIKYEILLIAGGISFNNIEGCWFNDNGIVYTDKSIQVTTLTDHATVQKLMQLAPKWALQLEQECILVEVIELNAMFVQGIEHAEVAI